MNKLYGILTSDCTTNPSQDYYTKLHTPVVITDRALDILTCLIHNVPQARRRMFACFICSIIADTRFGSDILKLDPDNTYNPFVRDPSKAADDAMLSLWDVISNSYDMQELIVKLDADIQDALCVPTWIDTVSGVCLQLLREVA